MQKSQILEIFITSICIAKAIRSSDAWENTETNAVDVNVHHSSGQSSSHILQSWTLFPSHPPPLSFSLKIKYIFLQWNILQNKLIKPFLAEPLSFSLQEAQDVLVHCYYHCGIPVLTRA